MAAIDSDHALINLATMAEVKGAKEIDETGTATVAVRDPVSQTTSIVMVPLGLNGWRIVRRR